jgi:hypothetical protein
VRLQLLGIILLLTVQAALKILYTTQLLENVIALLIAHTKQLLINVFLVFLLTSGLKAKIFAFIVQ